MNTPQILKKIPLDDDNEDRRNYVNIGIDRFPVFTSFDKHKDVVNNNSDKCEMNRLHEAMDVYCWYVLERDGILASEPRLKKICTDEQNHFFYSRCKSYRFKKDKAHSDDKLHEKVNDFKYLINHCGSHLEYLNLKEYPFSQIMPFIITNCRNLKELLLQFKEFENQDFENVFHNMCHLEVLRIHWQCKNSTLPLTLVKSLEEVRRTLKELSLSRNQNEKYLGLPDLLASVFPQLITLNKLKLINFEPSQSLVQSIGEIKNLVHLRIMCSWLNNHSVFDKTINMCPIGNLQHLETLYIDYDCGVTDEFLINLCNNAKKLAHLDIIGKNITDNGMIALNNLKQLESLKFNLNKFEKNDFITDQSVQCLAYEKCEYLHLSNCSCITDISVVKLFENLPNLKILYVRNTNVTFKIVTEILELTKYREKPIFVYASFEDRDDIFKSSALSDVFFKSNFNNDKYIDVLI